MPNLPATRETSAADRAVLMRLRVPDRLAELMVDRGESCATLAAKTACSKSMIGHLRRGRYRTNAALAARIEVVLGLPLGTLFEPVVVDGTAAA